MMSEQLNYNWKQMSNYIDIYNPIEMIINTDSGLNKTSDPQSLTLRISVDLCYVLCLVH